MVDEIKDDSGHPFRSASNHNYLEQVQISSLPEGDHSLLSSCFKAEYEKH